MQRALGWIVVLVILLIAALVAILARKVRFHGGYMAVGTTFTWFCLIIFASGGLALTLLVALSTLGVMLIPSPILLGMAVGIMVTMAISLGGLLMALTGRHPRNQGQ